MGGAVVLTLAAAVPQQAAAQSVFFSGFTTGCFGPGCTPVAAASTQGLSFSGGSFTNTTVDGFGAVGTSAGNNFGVFSLNPMAANYMGTAFTLLVQFVNPTPGHTQTFAAAISGRITGGGAGGVFVNFADNSPQVWMNGGTYSVSVNDLSVGPGGSVPVSGNLTATVPGTVVPEPISMTLLGTGLLGVGLARRRRRQASKADLV